MINWSIDSVLLHRQPVDFRKSINGLAAIVEQEIAEFAMSGKVFAFCNKNKDKIKVLYWDKTGFALWQKRLEKISSSGPIRSQMMCSHSQLSSGNGSYQAYR